MSQINDLNKIDLQSFTTTTGDNHNVPFDSSNVQVTCTSDNDAITGGTVPMDSSGFMVWIQNASAANTLVIKNNDAGSTAGYRFILGGGSTTLTLEAGQGQLFIFVSGTGWSAVRTGTFA